MSTLGTIAFLIFALPAAAQEPRPADPALFARLAACETSLRGKLAGQPAARAVLEAFSAARESGLREPPSLRDRLAQDALPRINAAAESMDAAGAGKQDAQSVDDAVAALDDSAGDFTEALRFCDRAIEREPSDEAAWVSRSQASFGLQRYISALADAERAIALQGRDAAAYRARAMAEYGLKRYPEAEQDARRALALDPSDRQALFVMELARHHAPSLDLAALKPGMPSPAKDAAPAPASPALTQASPDAAAQDAGQPPSTEGLVRSAARKLAVQDYAGAIDDADRALSMDPQNTAAYYYRAAAHNLAGDYADAADDASRALAINPEDAAARDTRAWAFNHMGRYRDAIADSNNSLEINPRNAYAFANLGYAHEQMGDVSSMLRDLKTAADMNPQFVSAYRDAAQRYGEQSDPQQEAAQRQAKAAAKRRTFLTLMASSLIGGLLIALGVVQVLGDSPRRAPLPLPLPAPPAVSGLDGYVLGRKLGMGGMGIVYEAYDKMLERPVAVKRIRDELQGDPDVRRRLLQEARTVASLHHPGIIDIHSIIEDRTGFYLVFELLEGKTVADLLVERGSLTLSECKKVLRPVCEALGFAHRHLVVHRDLKPANIMITGDGPVKVLDFGISRQAQPRLASLDPADRRTGTPQYMAPEQERGLVRPESDVFSLGTCLYEMLTGRYPFPDPNGLQKTTLDYARPSKIDPALPPELDAFLDAALQPDPDKRIRTAMEFWGRLDAIPSRPAPTTA